jgi:hypothetical protein
MVAEVHGTRSTYNMLRCRCPLCTEANTEYGRKLRYRKAKAREKLAEYRMSH